jgi:hypothetical protein
MALDLFAGICVRDFATAQAWYERLLGGPPSFVAHATEAVWELAEHRSIYVVEDADRAGRAVVTLFVDDLDAWVDGIASRSVEPALRETYGNGVRKVTFRDDDGNEIGFGGAPA